MSKIIGVTVGTPISPAKIAEKLKPVKTVNGVEPDENGNVELDIIAGEGTDGLAIYYCSLDTGIDTHSHTIPYKHIVTHGRTLNIGDLVISASGQLGWIVFVTDVNVTISFRASLKGNPGYTPVKGIDYYTEAEKNAMVNDVLNALPKWEGGEY